MSAHRKASAIILDLADTGRMLVIERHKCGQAWRARIEAMRDEMQLAGQHDPSGRGQFLAGAPAILAACLLVILQKRESPSDPFVVADWEQAALPFVTLAQADAYEALNYETKEGVA